MGKNTRNELIMVIHGCQIKWNRKLTPVYSAQFINTVYEQYLEICLIQLASRIHCRPWRTEGMFSLVTELSFLITENSCWWKIILIALCRNEGATNWREAF